jgi:hypothetical protein
MYFIDTLATSKKKTESLAKQSDQGFLSSFCSFVHMSTYYPYSSGLASHGSLSGGVFGFEVSGEPLSNGFGWLRCPFFVCGLFDCD